MISTIYTNLIFKSNSSATKVYSIMLETTHTKFTIIRITLAKKKRVPLYESKALELAPANAGQCATSLFLKPH